MERRESEGMRSCAADVRHADKIDLALLRERRTCSVEEAAHLLGIGRSTAYAAAHDGSLPTLKLSHRLLVPTAKLKQMLGLEDQS